MISVNRFKHSGLAGGIISLLGTLPFGVLNVLAFTIAAKESFGNAILFSAGVVVSELIVVACCLKWIKLSRTKTLAFELLQYAMVAFIFFLAIQQLLQIGTMSKEKTDLLSSNWPRFLLGLGLSAINPSQFTFWIAWNGILENNDLLESKKNRIHYLFGIGLGTFCGLGCFIVASQLIVNSSDLLQSKAYYSIMAGIFALTGGFMLFKLLQKTWKWS